MYNFEDYDSNDRKMSEFQEDFLREEQDMEKLFDIIKNYDYTKESNNFEFIDLSEENRNKFDSFVETSLLYKKRSEKGISEIQFIIKFFGNGDKEFNSDIVVPEIVLNTVSQISELYDKYLESEYQNEYFMLETEDIKKSFQGIF